jgi:hypothetical protein
MKKIQLFISNYYKYQILLGQYQLSTHFKLKNLYYLFF